MMEDGEEQDTLPLQIVRPFRPAIDHFPAYTTMQLMVGGVCHVVWIKGKNPYGLARKRIGAIRSVATRKEAAKQRFMEKRPLLRDLLACAATNGEIAKRLEVSVATVRAYIYQSSELQALAKARPGVSVRSDKQTPTREHAI